MDDMGDGMEIVESEKQGVRHAFQETQTELPIQLLEQIRKRPARGSWTMQT
jgi:hypothetical protein